MAIQISGGLGKLPWYVQIGVFVVLSIGAAGAFYYLYEMPLQEDLAGRQKRLTALRADINKAQATGRQLAQFQAQARELQARLDALKPVLPEQKDASELLRRIETLATQSNLTVEAFTPKAIATKQFHAEWPIVLQLDGSYHNLGRFFDKISKVPRIINISELAIRGKDKPEPHSTIVAECTATTFVLLEAPAAAPAAAAGARAGR
jgi:type IV pilus assembly protein PilO